MSCSGASWFSVGCGENVLRRAWTAPHHLSEGFSKVLREEGVEEGIETWVEVSQDVAYYLNRYAERRRVVEPQGFQHQNDLDRGPANGERHNLRTRKVFFLLFLCRSEGRMRKFIRAEAARNVFEGVERNNFCEISFSCASVIRDSCYGTSEGRGKFSPHWYLMVMWVDNVRKAIWVCWTFNETLKSNRLDDNGKARSAFDVKVNRDVKKSFCHVTKVVLRDI